MTTSISRRSADLDWDALYDRIYAFQQRVKGASYPRDLDAATQELAILLLVEAVEILGLTSFKPHKRRVELDRALIRGEIVDANVFLTALNKLWFDGPTDVYNSIVTKMAINDRRLDDVQKLPINPAGQFFSKRQLDAALVGAEG